MNKLLLIFLLIPVFCNGQYLFFGGTNSFGQGFNPAKKGAQIILSNMNEKAYQFNSGTASCVLSKRGIADTSVNPLVYCEIATLTGGSGYDFLIGFGDSAINVNNFCGHDVHGWGYESVNGHIWNNNSDAPYGSTYNTVDTVMLALNMTTGKGWIGLNGSWPAGGNPATGANPTWTGFTGTMYICAGSGNTVDVKFYLLESSGQFGYVVPVGYVALNH